MTTKDQQLVFRLAQLTPADFQAVIEQAAALRSNRCACGNADKLPGYRVCESCKEARELYPHIFAALPSDKLS